MANSSNTILVDNSEDQSEETTTNLKLHKKEELLPLIYFIDDDVALMNINKVVLKNDYNVECFEDPFDCLKEAEESVPDLIIIDMKMPNIDGIEVIKLIQSNPAISHIPFVCTSASGSMEERTYLNSNGASGFLKKPYEKESLSKDISNIVESLTQNVFSEDHTMESTICYNDVIKDKLIFNKMTELLRAGEYVFFISWSKGNSKIGQQFSEEIKKNQLIYLEIKSSLIVKMPYMKDIAPLFFDIKKLAPGTKLKKSHLIFDNVRSLVNSEEPERAFSTMIDLAKLSHTSFKKSHYIMTRFTDTKYNLLIAKIAKLLTGRYV